MNLKTMGDRAFRAYGPVQWNKLPLSLRSLSNVELKDDKTIKRPVETFKKTLKLIYSNRNNISKVKSKIIHSRSCCY